MSDISVFPNRESNPKLLDAVRACIRRRNDSLRTEKAYLDWIRRFIHFHALRHPQEMGTPEVSAFQVTKLSFVMSPR